jgi:acyl dehydratase
MTGFPAALQVTARLDDNPRYAGSVHDDGVAQKMGYRAALIPGAFVYTYAARLAVSAWGMDWVSGGAIDARFRRPVFNGDRLSMEAGALATSERGRFAEFSVINQLGETVVTGRIGLHREAVPRPMLEFRPQSDPRPVAGVGDIRPGTRFATTERELTLADLEASRAAMGEVHPVFLDNKAAHPGCLVRLTMDDVLRSYKLPIPPIFTAVETCNFAPVPPGSWISTSAVATEVFERNGKHYFTSEEYLVIDGLHIAARHRRTNLYSMDAAETSLAVGEATS